MKIYHHLIALILLNNLISIQSFLFGILNQRSVKTISTHRIIGQSECRLKRNKIILLMGKNDSDGHVNDEDDKNSNDVSMRWKFREE
jgi:site-specific recombinase